MHDVNRFFLHVVIHEFMGSLSFMIVHMLSGAPLPIHVRSVVLNLEGNKVDEEGFSVQGQARCWGKACFFLSSC